MYAVKADFLLSCPDPYCDLPDSLTILARDLGERQVQNILFPEVMRWVMNDVESLLSGVRL